MVNAVRSYLLLPAAGESPSIIGEELVPTFASPKLTPLLNDARTALFGHGYDRSGRNVMLSKILSVAHSTDLEEYVLRLDDRFTYTPGVIKNSSYFAGRTGYFPNTDSSPYLSIKGSIYLQSPGRAFGRWNVSSSGGVTTAIDLESGQTATGAESVDLPGSRLTATPNGDGGWEAWCAVPPRWSTQDQLRYMEPLVKHIMVSPGPEPEWWDSSLPGPVRVAAFAIALAERIAELA